MEFCAAVSAPPVINPGNTELSQHNVLDSVTCLLSQRDKNSVTAFGDSDSEIRVLTVKDGEGRELREAKFVEILKEARHRIRSATIRGTKGIV